MNNGIKPTRLWHLTGMKHFRKNIMDRECSRPPHNQRDRRNFIQLVGIVIASALGIMGSYGILSPPPKAPVAVKCDTSRSKKSSCKPPTEPCPAKPDKPMPSCKGEED